MKRWQWAGPFALIALLGCVAWLASRGHAQAAHPPDLTAPPLSETAVLRVVPPPEPVMVGERFTVTVDISDLPTSLAAFQFDLAYDAALIRSDGISPGSFLRVAGRNIICPSAATPSAGVLRTACATAGSGAAPAGSGALAEISFVALSEGTSPLALQEVKLADTALPPSAIGASTVGGEVTILPEPPEPHPHALYLPMVMKNSPTSGASLEVEEPLTEPVPPEAEAPLPDPVLPEAEGPPPETVLPAPGEVQP